MRAAVIDIGTNTFHLIIAEVSAGKINVIYKTNVPVKLGEGRLNDHIIIEAAFERGLQTLSKFSEEIKKHQVDVVKATATSAVRSAENGQDFVHAVQQLTGITITVIDGEQEAEYIFKGVQATGILKETSLVMDIGGGSTEFIICRPNEVLWKKSYNIGAARLMQAYFKTDPLTVFQKSAINTYLETTLADLKIKCDLYEPKLLIGSAGAFESFAGMINPDLDLKNSATAHISLAEYQQLSAKLLTSTHQQRTQMKGLIPLRVDMIVMAALLTDYVLTTVNLQHIMLSTYDLKMGVLSELAHQKS